MSDGYPGSAGANVSYSEYNQLQFMMRSFMSTVRTAALVQVQACTNNDNLAAVGTVDVLPLVDMMDGQGNGTSKLGTLYELPYFRMQGGLNAVIMDPRVGDIGIAIFCDRDITTVKSTKKQALPNTPRRFSLSDGLYIGGFLNAQPNQYVQFTRDGNGNPTGMNITDINTNTIVMDTNGITINGVKFDRNQNVSNVKDLTTTGNASLGGGSKKIVLDGDPVVSGAVVASSTKAKAT